MSGKLIDRFLTVRRISLARPDQVPITSDLAGFVSVYSLTDRAHVNSARRDAANSTTSR
jgi:hypothetical protein